MTTKDTGEPFLERWSRRKRETSDQPQRDTQASPPGKEADPVAPKPDLPPPDKLTFESDYRAFFHPKVGEDVRRAALKRLFSAPHFNVMDGLDVYIDDYSKSEPIPAAMLASLRQAQKILEWAKGDGDEKKRDALPDKLADRQQSAPEGQHGSPEPHGAGRGVQAPESIAPARDQTPTPRSSENA